MRLTCLLFILCLLGAASFAVAEEESWDDVGIDQRLGERIPLDDLQFVDEEGTTISLASLFDRPIILTLVYYRCPSICSPLLAEVSRVIQNCDLTPGEDYRLVSISFDPEEGPDLTVLKKENMLAAMEKKPAPPDAWRFLTGNEENIRRITEAVGFRYIRDPNEVDYIHAAVVIFLSSDGMIARYLEGMQFNPADMELAVVDASTGTARAFMRKAQRLCYSFDENASTYVLQVNRLILGLTGLFVVLFLVFLVVKKPAAKPEAADEDDTPKPGATESVT